jgi:hypothetical protein
VYVAFTHAHTPASTKHSPPFPIPTIPLSIPTIPGECDRPRGAQAGDDGAAEQRDQGAAGAAEAEALGAEGDAGGEDAADAGADGHAPHLAAEQGRQGPGAYTGDAAGQGAAGPVQRPQCPAAGHRPAARRAAQCQGRYDEVVHVLMCFMCVFMFFDV